MRYLKKFGTHSDYEKYMENNINVPNVSICAQEKDIHYVTSVQPLRFEVEGSGAFTLAKYNTPTELSFEVSRDGGTTWEDYTAGHRIAFGGTLYLRNKSEVPTLFSTNDGYYQFSLETPMKCHGDITCLLCKNGNVKEITSANYCFVNLFSGCTQLLTPPSLPSTTLRNSCYENMFCGCTSLTSAPQLPATTLMTGCYNGMFSGCTSLTSAPQLPAIDLSNYSYRRMFADCTSLIDAPALPATGIAEFCYIEMFARCTSLTKAPTLAAPALDSSCYNYMFDGCTSLNYIECLAEDIDPEWHSMYWARGVAANGTFVQSAKATWTKGDSGIPNGWTVIKKI